MKELKRMQTDSEFLGTGLMTIVIMVLAVPLRPFVLTQLWGWFLVPLGVPGVSIWVAWGVLLVGSLFRRVQLTTPSDKAEARAMSRSDALGHALTRSIATPMVCWGLGAIAHWIAQ